MGYWLSAREVKRWRDISGKGLFFGVFVTLSWKIVFIVQFYDKKLLFLSRRQEKGLSREH